MNVKNRKKILWLEERLMNLLVITVEYQDIPPIFLDIQINEVLIELEKLQGE